MHDNDMPKTNTLVKICGLTSEEQALQVAKLGAHAIGIISVEESPRYVSPEIKKKIFKTNSGRMGSAKLYTIFE